MYMIRYQTRILKNFNFPVNYFSTLESSLINSDVVIIATAWPEFLKLKILKKVLKYLILDSYFNFAVYFY